MSDVEAKIVVAVTIIGWSILFGLMFVDRRRKNNIAKADMVWARADERTKILAQLEALDWWVDDPDHEDPISTGVVLRDEMLALFKEVSDGSTTP